MRRTAARCPSILRTRGGPWAGRRTVRLERDLERVPARSQDGPVVEEVPRDRVRRSVAVRHADVDQVAERGGRCGTKRPCERRSVVQANGAPHADSVTVTGPPGPPPGMPTNATVGSATVATAFPWLHCVASFSHVVEPRRHDVSGHEVGAARAHLGRHVQRVVRRRVVLGRRHGEQVVDRRVGAHLRRLGHDQDRRGLAARACRRDRTSPRRRSPCRTGPNRSRRTMCRERACR